MLEVFSRDISEQTQRSLTLYFGENKLIILSLLLSQVVAPEDSSHTPAASEAVQDAAKSVPMISTVAAACPSLVGCIPEQILHQQPRNQGI